MTVGLLSAGTDKKVWWQCQKNPAHEWETLIYNRTAGYGGCLSGVGFFGNLPSIPLQLPVSPQAKQAIEEKRSWGDTPQAPGKGRSPLQPRF